MSDLPLSKRAAALEDLGFSRNEAILYEQLLKFSGATIQDLAKKTDFSRTLLYYILGQLQASGMVTTEKVGSKTTYSAADPAILHDILKSREDDLTRQKASVSQLVNSFSGDFRLANNKPGIRFFEGRSGIEEALNDATTATETIYTFLDYDAVQQYAADLDDSQYKTRRAKHISKRILVIDSPLSRKTFTNQDPDTEVRFLPRSISIAHTTVQIYNNKIVYFTLRAEHLIAVMISDPDLCAMQRNMFDYIWNQAAALNRAGSVAFRSE